MNSFFIYCYQFIFKHGRFLEEKMNKTKELGKMRFILLKNLIFSGIRYINNSFMAAYSSIYLSFCDHFKNNLKECTLNKDLNVLF